MTSLLDKMESPQKKGSQKNYSAKDIEVLEGLDPVRHRPGMYIGGTDEKALHHLVAEILDNAMDEVGANHATIIKIHLGKNGYVTISDNGRGIPVDAHPKFPDKSALEVILTTLHSGGKFNNKNYETAGGLHGVGISVVNALSEHLVAEVKREGKLWHQEYSRGLPTTKLKAVEKLKEPGTGSSISFKPDPEIFGDDVAFKAAIVYKMARSRAYLHRGVRILWSCDEGCGPASVPLEAEFHFPQGIVDFLKTMIENRELLVPVPFQGHMEFPNKAGRIEWAITWAARGDGAFTSYCNTIGTTNGGTHENGFRHALLKGMKDFGELTKAKNHSKITADDVFCRSVAVISVFIPNPQFQGQTKEKLATATVAKLVENAVKDHFDHWLTGNMEGATALLESMIGMAELREKQKQERDETRKPLSQKLRLPGKLADCTQQDPKGTELFLVEGDSAGGSAKQARDRFTQAILPLKGKILNVANATIEKLRANQSIQDLEKTLGCGTRDHYKEDKLRYEKIIIMTDADVDGAHIASLLMTFFYKELRPLIENGHLYLAQPPLYRLSQGGKSIYVKDDKEKEKVLKEEFKGSAKVEVSRFKGLGEMSPVQLRDTTMHRDKRTLLQIKLTDVDNKNLEELEIFVENVMGKNPETRFDFIQQNAQFVEDLDV